MNTRPKRARTSRASSPLLPLPPLPEPFVSLFGDALTDKDRRALRATGMTDAQEIEFLDRIVLNVLGEMCVEAARKRGEAKRK